MWCTWATLILVTCALVTAEDPGAAPTETTRAPLPDSNTSASRHTEEETEENLATTTQVDDSTVADALPLVATTRAPLRTLDRLGDELAWKSWLQSPESVNQNAPPRRITTKSLFITPLVCPKGQRLDRNGCVQPVTVDKDEHERILLEQLNALFSSPSTGDVLYDYDDEDRGPLQLSLPIGLDPQTIPLPNQEPSAQAQEMQPNVIKKDDSTAVEAELELLKLPHSQKNYTDILSHNVMNSFQSHDKPKRESDDNIKLNMTDTSDTGQKELVYGHVNVDPVLYNLENANQTNQRDQIEPLTDVKEQSYGSFINVHDGIKMHTTNKINEKTVAEKVPNSSVVKADLINNNSQSKLRPENDYSDIGEAIKVISRYAQVSTDDNFNRDQMKLAAKEDNILGTRTKSQYRRNKPKPEKINNPLILQSTPKQPTTYHHQKHISHSPYPSESYYRYPWPNQHSQTPPPNYPFRHVQDYWPGKSHMGGVYNNHGNPIRHHHSYPYYYYRPHGYNSQTYSGIQETYSDQYADNHHRVVQRHVKPTRTEADQNLYSLLGLRHWFSSEGISKR